MTERDLTDVVRFTEQMHMEQTVVEADGSMRVELYGGHQSRLTFVVPPEKRQEMLDWLLAREENFGPGVYVSVSNGPMITDPTWKEVVYDEARKEGVPMTDELADHILPSYWQGETCCREQVREYLRDE